METGKNCRWGIEKYLDDGAKILRRQSIETPGGQMRTDGREILLRGKTNVKREKRLKLYRLSRNLTEPFCESRTWAM